MNETPKDRLDWLLSERLDRALTADEAAELAQALADDATGSRRVRAFDQLDGLLKKWAAAQPEVDWETLKSRYGAEIADVTELAISEQLDRKIDAGALVAAALSTAPADDQTRAAYERTESAIRGWRAALPPVNWQALQSRISVSVAQEAARAAARSGVARRTGQWRWAARVAAPLAAAAVVALVAFWPTRESDNSGNVRPDGSAALVVVELDSPTTTGRVAVRFDPGQLAAAPASGVDDAPSDSEGGQVIAVTPSSNWNVDSPEDAFYY